MNEQDSPRSSISPVSTLRVKKILKSVPLGPGLPSHHGSQWSGRKTQPADLTFPANTNTEPRLGNQVRCLAVSSGFPTHLLDQVLSFDGNLSNPTNKPTRLLFDLTGSQNPTTFLDDEELH